MTIHWIKLIAELDRVVPPDPDVPSDMQAAMTEFQMAAEIILGDDGSFYRGEGLDPDDPEIREAAERMRRGQNIMLGRAPDYVPAKTRPPRGRRPTPRRRGRSDERIV